MEIILGIVVIGLIGIILYQHKTYADIIVKMRTIDKARDVQEIKEYLLPHDQITTSVIAESPVVDLEDMEEQELAKIINSANGER